LCLEYEQKKNGKEQRNQFLYYSPHDETLDGIILERFNPYSEIFSSNFLRKTCPSGLHQEISPLAGEQGSGKAITVVQNGCGFDQAR
jgi:hypothetical protein